MKKTTKSGIKWSLFIAAFVLSFTIVADGWWKLIGLIAILYMGACTIATWVTESKDE